MIHWILNSLIYNDINDITICVGYCAEKVIDYCNKFFGQVRFNFVNNRKYNTTNNLYSLYLARGSLSGDCILMNADLVYERSIIESLTMNSAKSIICAQKGAYIEESMKITVDGNDNITGISKQIDKTKAYGVSIDIYKFLSKDVQMLRDGVINEIENKQSVNLWTETLMNDLIQGGKIEMRPLDIEDNLWIEIDNYDDLYVADKMFNPHLNSLRNKKAMIFDFDGTLSLGDRPIDGAKEVLQVLINCGKLVYLMTNNSSCTSKEYQEKIKQILQIDMEIGVINSLDLALDYFNKNGIKKLFCVANKNVELYIKSCGFIIDEEDPKALLLTYDTEIDYEKIKKLIRFINLGFPYYATHIDMVCPISHGYFLPDIGTFIVLIKTTTGILPVRTFGKPGLEGLYYVSEKHGLDFSDIAVVGDRLYTDIEMCKNNEATSVLVFSGETTRELYEESKIKADIMLQSVKDMLEFL